MMDPVRARLNVRTVVTPEATTRTAVQPEDAKLRKAVADLQGLFVQQLFKAMRDTVPQGDGIVSGGSGEEIFTSLMDQHVAAETPTRWEGGVGEALYRQLRGAPIAGSRSAHAPVVENHVSAVSTVPSAH